MQETQTIVAPAGALKLHDRLEISCDVRRGDVVCFRRTAPGIVSLCPAGEKREGPVFRAIRSPNPGVVVFEALTRSAFPQNA